MRLLSISILALLCQLSLFAQRDNVGKSFTLEQCISYALENNFDQRSLEITRELREIVLDQSKKERYLDLSASASQNVSYSHEGSKGSWNGSYSLGTNTTLYNGGVIANTIKQNQLGVSQESTRLAQAQNSLIINIIQAYLSVLMNEELLKFQREVVKSSLEQVNQGRSQLNASKIIESDFLLLESQYASDKYNEVNTTINRNNSVLKLKNLLSMSSSSVLDITPIDTMMMTHLSKIPQIQYVVEQTLIMSPDIELTRQNIESARLDTKIVKAGFYPSVGVGASIGTGYNRGGGNFGRQISRGLGEQVGLSINIPIFSKGKVRSNVAQSEGRQRQAQLESEKIRLAVMQQVEQDYQTVVANFAQYEALQIKQNAYRESFRVYRSQFNAGSITAADLLIQQNSYLSAVSDLLQSKYSFILNRKILDVYMGVSIKL